MRGVTTLAGVIDPGYRGEIRVVVSNLSGSAVEIKAGDRIEVIRRPRHTVTVGRSFRALTTETELLPSLLEAGDDLPPEERAAILRRSG